MANRGRPKGSGIAIDAKKLAALAHLQCLQQEMACELNISEEQFCRKLGADAELKAVLEGGKTRGRIVARRAIFAAMMDHYFTKCNECGQIMDSPDAFFDQCQNRRCGSVDVKHDFKQGDHDLLKFFAKNYLNMSDKVTVQGDEDKPLIFSTLSEFVKNRAKKNAAKAKEALAQVTEEGH